VLCVLGIKVCYAWTCGRALSHGGGLLLLQVVGFVPTGWTYEMRKAAAAGGPYPFPVRTKAACSVWLVPYSEHSSFPELREYVGFIKPKQVWHIVYVAWSKQKQQQQQQGGGLLACLEACCDGPDV